MTFRKGDLFRSVHDNVGLSKSGSSEVVEFLLEIIKKTLENGEDILVGGFGKFYVGEKRKRRGRNPVTGNDLTLRERKIVTFQCSPVLRDKINRT